MKKFRKCIAGAALAAAFVAVAPGAGATETQPLPWDSEALAALTAFVLERHRKVVRK